MSDAVLSVVSAGVIAVLGSLGGVYLGGWMDRNNRREAEAAAFQFETMVDLQDTINELMDKAIVFESYCKAYGYDRCSGQIANQTKDFQAGGDVPALKELVSHITEARDLQAAYLESFNRAYRLNSRVKDVQVRERAKTLLALCSPIEHEPVVAKMLQSRISLDDRLGCLIRQECKIGTDATLARRPGTPDHERSVI